MEPFFIDFKEISFLCELKANPLEINTSFSKAGFGEEDEKVVWVTLPQQGRDGLLGEGIASCSGGVSSALAAGGDSQQCPRPGRSGRGGRGVWQGPRAVAVPRTRQGGGGARCHSPICRRPRSPG